MCSSDLRGLIQDWSAELLARLDWLHVERLITSLFEVSSVRAETISHLGDTYPGQGAGAAFTHDPAHAAAGAGTMLVFMRG